VASALRGGLVGGFCRTIGVICLLYHNEISNVLSTYIYISYTHTYIYIHTGVDLKDHVSVFNSQGRQCYNMIPRESDFLISRKFIFGILECPFEKEV
jgi:hypothetical protein